ncbi:MAG TPA: hypothetical protein VIM65_01340 [Cyclobacteriaceae bacterium]
MKLTIQAFSTKEENSNWILLPETSQYLTDKQIIPNVGDALTIAGQDGKLIDLERGSHRHIMTVKIKWLNYASADVAVLLHYVVF